MKKQPLLYSFFLVLLSMYTYGQKPQNKLVKLSNNAPTSSESALFGKNFISTGMFERDFTMSADGNHLFYTVRLNGNVSAIVFSEFQSGNWTRPQVASFSGHYKDIEPMFHPDGNKLFFVSNRPVENETKASDYNIWYVKKTEDGWSEPVNPGAPLNTEQNEFYPSFTKDGTIYFCTEYDDSRGGEDLYYCTYKNGTYQPPQNMGDSINSKAGEYNAFIDPEGSWIMYNTHIEGDGYGSGDIYIAFKDADGAWNKPINMGPEINSPYFEYCPSLTPDGKYLFFTSQRINPLLLQKPVRFKDMKKIHNEPKNGNGDLYWIDAGIIEKLRKKKFP